jgi:signal transduction histidine kinase/ActR/RegA family two-component response regulator
MEGVLNQVTGFAIWGSLSATVVLGAFLLVQAVVDPPRRRRFGLLSAAMWFLAAVDFLRSLGYVGPSSYEQLRLLWSGAYAGAVLWLFGRPPLRALAAALALPAFGFAVFYGYRADLATTMTYPLSFGLVAYVHFDQYRKGRGFASALLAACSAVQAIMCALYYTTISSGNPEVMILGYAHYASVAILGVLLGWVHLPREIRGRSPVKMSPATARVFGGAFLALELPLQLGLLVYYRRTPTLFLAAAAIQQMIALAFYFVHRHQLVIHADNVGQLLEERTGELRSAQAELARQNEILAERLAEQARDLQAKTQVIDRQRRLELAAQTAGQVAHDIQNLVSPILVRLDRPADGNAETYGVIRRQVEQLMALNTQLLALSRRGRVERLPVSLADVVRDAVTRFPGQAISTEVRGASWVSGSASQLGRAVSNLIANALESDLDRRAVVTVRSGVMELAANRRCHLGFLSPGRYSMVEVEDLGTGIPEKDLDKIFEPFFSSKGARHQSGSGLGLTIVAAVVDDHQGVLDLQTGPKGTKFMLYFPSLQAPSEAPSAPGMSCNATVLIVEDDSSQRANLAAELSKTGYTVVTSGSGREALQALQSTSVDLLLLDCGLPDMSGQEVLLGALHVRPGIRAVIHSSYLTGDQEAALKAVGASSILTKPAPIAAVLAALHQAQDEQVETEKRAPTRLD